MRDFQRYLTERFVADMWEIAEMHDGSISGGCRTPTRNAHVGGSTESRHLFKHGWGLACDFVFDTAEGRTAAKVDAAGRGWHTYIGPDYGPLRLHVQAFEKGARLPTVEV